MEEPQWLDRFTVDLLHEQLILDFGGTAGVRDDGLIESALARPIHKWAYGGETLDLPALAAAYAYGLAKNHGFVDGNKRVAATAMGVFLMLNGFELNAPEEELVFAVQSVARDDWGEPELTQWVRGRTRPLEESL